MLSWLTAVVEDVGLRTTGLFQGIGEDGHSVVGTFFVDCRRQLPDGRREPTGVDGDGTEGERAEDAAQHRCLEGERSGPKSGPKGSGPKIQGSPEAANIARDAALKLVAEEKAE
jgi:hypothetical protein